jgi:predicted homoserine dehydrogenase-like protein
MLQNLSRQDKDINIVVIGIGSIGKGIVFQSRLTPHIECVGIADIKIERAIACAEWLERPYQVVQTKGELSAAIEGGNLAVTDNGQLLAQCELADALIEASNAIYAGAQHAITALRHGLHTIMMNYEADLMYGPLLLSVAEEAGVVYSSCDGDQPAVIKRMIDDIFFWGFDLVMAGNIKGYLDRYVNPTSIIPEADKRHLDYKMCTSYTDGTKLGVEMAVLANALGLRTAVPGMIGPRANHISEVFTLFDFDDLWSRNRQPLVDYVLGAEPKGGVFVIAHTDQPFQQFTLDWFPPDMGPGPYYLFYRPYHLGHIEALSTVVEAVLESRSLLKPDHGLMTNVFAYARKDLKKGDTLDGLGGYACYGLIENVEDHESQPGLPICFANDVTLKRKIDKDERVTLDDVNYDSSDPKFRLFADTLAIRRKRVQ